MIEALLVGIWLMLIAIMVIIGVQTDKIIEKMK